jgi:hypothetical protein
MVPLPLPLWWLLQRLLDCAVRRNQRTLWCVLRARFIMHSTRRVVCVVALNFKTSVIFLMIFILNLY